MLESILSQRVYKKGCTTDGQTPEFKQIETGDGIDRAEKERKAYSNHGCAITWRTPKEMFVLSGDGESWASLLRYIVDSQASLG